MSLLPSSIEIKLLKITEKLASNKHLNALKDGFAYAMPFIIVGALVLVLVNLPFLDKSTTFYWGWYDSMMIKYKAKLVQPFYVSMSILSLYVSFGIAYSLCNQYKLPAVTGGLLSIFSFLMVAAPTDWIPLSDAKWGLQAGAWLPVLDARFLDAKGLFTAILVAFFSVHVYRFLLAKRLVFSLPNSVPPALARSFEILIPIFVLAVILQTVNIAFSELPTYSLPNAIMYWFGLPLLDLTDNLLSVIIILLLIHLLWLFGLHGGNIVLAVITPIILTNFQLNLDAVQAGQIPTKIFTAGFFDYFVYAGGAGATLGLTILLLFSKQENFKKLGQVAIVPSIFNINEPVIFGTPMVGNPILGIPFIIIPIINATIAWFAIKLDIIPKITALAPWTVPAPLGALIGTQSFIAFVLSCTLIILSIILYLPFFRIYERTFAIKK